MIRQPPRSTLFPHDALPISQAGPPATMKKCSGASLKPIFFKAAHDVTTSFSVSRGGLKSQRRSEEHTSELQSPYDIVCRLLLEKNKSSPMLSRHHIHTSPTK